MRHHHCYHYCCYYWYYGNANNKELAFFKCTVWNNVVAVLQPHGARLLQVMLLAWHGVCSNMGALGWHWITSQGDGESDPAELGETTQNSLERERFQNHAPEPNWNAGAGAPYSVCTDVTLLRHIKLPSARMKCYLKNPSNCILAFLLPPSNEALANHLLALQFTCPLLCTCICWSLQLKEKRMNTLNTCNTLLTM